MNKLFDVLKKPAKWIFVIGAFAYALWFAIQTAGQIDGGFMSVMTRLVLLIVGTALLVISPVFVLLNKNEIAKLVFIFLMGFWLLNSIQSWFALSEAYANSGEGLPIVTSIFTFIAGLGLVAILVLTILEFALKKPALRNISLIVFLGVIGVSFIAGILNFITAIIYELGWINIVSSLFDFVILPTIICFGYLHFFTSQVEKGE